MARTSDLHQENARLKRLLADAELEKASLRERMTALTDAPRPPATRGGAEATGPPAPETTTPQAVTPLRSGLREIKRQRVRRLIEEVALELFDQHGFEATTVEEIAAAAEVSPRTFFRYFASKEDVLLVIMDEVQEEMLTEVRSHYDGSPESLLGALVTFSQGLDRRRGELLRAVRLLGQPSLYAGRLRHSRALEDTLASIVATTNGHASPDCHDRALAALAGSAMSISMRIWLEGDAEGPFQSVFVTTLGVLAELGQANGQSSEYTRRSSGGR